MRPKNSLMFQLWNVIYPVLIYFVVMNLSMSLFAMLAVFLGADPKEQYMTLQTAAAAAAIPFIAWYYRKDKSEPTFFWEHMRLELEKKSLAVKTANGALMFLTGAAAGVALNNILALTKLQEISQDYQEISEYFFSGGILFEVLAACVLTPFLEELLYRGVVYGRLCALMISEYEGKGGRGRKRERQSRILAMVISALLFGAFHRNLVQFVYAGLLGILLAWLMEKTGHFYGAFFAHMGANLMSVLRAETAFFSWMQPKSAAFYAGTAGFAAAAVAAAVVIQILSARQRQH